MPIQHLLELPMSGYEKMSAKDSFNYDEKYSEAKRATSKSTDDDEDIEFYDDKASSRNSYSRQTTSSANSIQVNVLSITVTPPGEVDLSAELSLRISFELDRDVIAGYWTIQFLVDTASRRIIKVLGKTDVEDYPEGESDMSFYVNQVDISGITPSTLSNSGNSLFHLWNARKHLERKRAMCFVQDCCRQSSWRTARKWHT